MIRLHPLSAILGAAIVGLCLLTMSQMRVAAALIGVEYLPHPRDMVQIIEGTPYTVPAGKILVITGVGSIGWQTSFRGFLTINGQRCVYNAANSGTGSGNVCSVGPVPTGLTAAAGAIVAVDDDALGLAEGRAWGYLAAQ